MKNEIAAAGHHRAGREGHRMKNLIRHLSNGLYQSHCRVLGQIQWRR